MADQFQIPGHSLLRLISDRERSKLFLARADTGEFCAVKLQKSHESNQLNDLVSRDSKLQALSRHDGLLEILACGTTGDGWTWKTLPLADNLPGLPPLKTDEGVQQYTPMNLLAWRTTNGANPPPAKLVAGWGVLLADAVAVLHAGGFVHRDVKPANVLFLHGKPCLGDYGLVGEPGKLADTRGTEGFQPLEGTSDTGADLFALGKTLYEVWTGGNRLEFPSLPREVLDAPDWDPAGLHLNEILTRACSNQPRQRFRSAAEMSSALAGVVAGHRPLNRRRWLATAASCSAVGAGLFLFLRHWKAPARVVWRRVRAKGFNVESWQGHCGTADWVRGQMYSFALDGRGGTFQAVDLRSYNLVHRPIQGGPTQAGSTLFHPHMRELLIIDGGRGEVFALNPETYVLRALGGGPQDERHFASRTYWNPVTGRAGIFGGYGHFAVRNDRCEFDAAAKAWIELEPDRENGGPWRRGAHIPLIPDAPGTRLFLVGGHGSRSGKQGEQMAGVRGFGGQFHMLDDVWELNLNNNTWRCLLPLGHFEPMRLHAAAYFPSVEGLVIFEGLHPGVEKPGPAKTWLLRPDLDSVPVPLPQSGEISRLATAWAFTMDPANGELLIFADDGIFRTAVLPA